MQNLSVSEFREHLREIGNKIAYAGDRVTIENHKKPYFAVVSCEDLELLELLEDLVDLQMAREALKRNDFVTWEDAKKELGI